MERIEPSEGATMQMRIQLAVVAAGALGMLCGCQKAPAPVAARVGGVVTFQGRPLSDGVVAFVPDTDRTPGGKMLTANVDRDGRFLLADGNASVVPGWYKVAIAESASNSFNDAYPAELRRPDRSGLDREVKAGHDHHFEFLIELTR